MLSSIPRTRPRSNMRCSDGGKSKQRRWRRLAMSSGLPVKAIGIFWSDFARKGWVDSSNAGGAEEDRLKPTTRSECYCATSISGIPAWDRTNWRVTARRKSASLLAVAPSTGSWPTRARGKKKGARRSLAPNRGDGFLCWGGDLQDIYERWRQTALLGGDAASFLPTNARTPCRTRRGGWAGPARDSGRGSGRPHGGSGCGLRVREVC